MMKKLAVFTGIIYHRIRTCNWRIAWETTGEHGEAVIGRLGAFWHVQAVFLIPEKYDALFRCMILAERRLCFWQTGRLIVGRTGQLMDEKTLLVCVKRK